MLGDRPLSALLSQVLVAFTLEFDNEFERRMIEAGYRGANLSLVVWSNLVRFVPEGGVPVRQLAARAMMPELGVKFQLGCLERWRFVELQGDAAGERMRRDGWGSGRGIRSGWEVRLTAKGRKASEIWPSLFDEIEGRWRARFGDEEIASLREALRNIEGHLDIELPQALPGNWPDHRAVGEAFPARGTHRTGTLFLPSLLSQVLLAFAIEFNRESRVPLALCANTLRVLSDEPIPAADIPRLTGASPETSGVGWQIKPFVTVETEGRTKVVRLTPLGLKVQQKYRHLTGEIVRRWEARFGKVKIQRLRESLGELFSGKLADGMAPAEGTIRAGGQAPALGRRDIGSAARQRMRDMVAQTEMFISDPANRLPHYPLWDMNRGFGP